MTIHSTAQVDPLARLGDGVTVGPFAVIEGDVEVGDRSVIGPHAVLLRYTRLGADCRVHAHAVLGDLPQDLAFRDAVTRVEIGDRVTIREGVTIHRGTKEGTTTRVGDDCFLMANSHLAHNVSLGRRVILANGVLLAGYVEIGDGAFISGNALVHQFCRIGRLAMVGGGAAISKDLPPFCMAETAGYNRVVGLNIVGLRRAGLDARDRQALRSAFKALYRSGLGVRAAAQTLAAAGGSGAVRELAEFVLASKRGVCTHRAARSGEAAETGDG